MHVFYWMLDWPNSILTTRDGRTQWRICSAKQKVSIMFDFILTASQWEFLTKISLHTSNGWANHLVRQFAWPFPHRLRRAQGIALMIVLGYFLPWHFINKIHALPLNIDHIIFCGTNIKKFSILYQGAKVWNSLPVTLVSSLPLSIKKKKLKNYLIERQLFL